MLLRDLSVPEQLSQQSCGLVELFRIADGTGNFAQRCGHWVLLHCCTYASTRQGQTAAPVLS